MKKQVILFLCIWLSKPVFAQEIPPTLKELLESAIRKSHQAEIGRQNLEISGIDRRKLQEAYLPVAELKGQYGFMAQNASLRTDATTLYLSDGAHALPALDNGISSTAHTAVGQLNFYALIYSGGKIPAMKKVLNEKIHAQEALLEKDRLQVVEEVLKVYDQLALLQEVKTLLDDSQKRLDIHQKTGAKALDYGLITPYEYQKLEVAQARLKHQQITYEGQHQTLLYQLAMYTGIAPERLALLENTLEQVQLMETATSDRPELRAMNHAVEAGKHRISAAQTWWKPRVVASASAGYLNLFNARIRGNTELPYGLGYNQLTTRTLQVAPDLRVGIGFQWDLFDGFKGKREVQKAKLEVKIAEQEREKVSEMLDLQQVKLQNDLQTANGEIRSRETQIAVAERGLALASKEFKTGLIKSSDLVDAENDYVSAALEYRQSVFNQRRAAFALMRAMGSLENIQ